MRELREMANETGTVLRVAPGRAWVRLAKNEACSACKGCGIGAGGKDMIAEVQDSLGVAVDDEIRIRPVKAIGYQKAALLIYGIPILLLFAGYAAGQALARAWGLDSSKEAPGALAGLLAMALGYVGLYLLSRRRRGGIGIFIAVEIINKRARAGSAVLAAEKSGGSHAGRTNPLHWLSEVAILSGLAASPVPGFHHYHSARSMPNTPGARLPSGPGWTAGAAVHGPRKALRKEQKPEKKPAPPKPY